MPTYLRLGQGPKLRKTVRHIAGPAILAVVKNRLIVQSHFARQVLDCETQRHPRPFHVMEEVVGSDSAIEKVAGLDPVRIVVVVFRTRLRKRQQLRRADAVAASAM